jgi:3-hydroxybutyrate dehydrogenase
MTASLAGKRAFVTGSVQGIGLAIARELGRAGAAVGLHGLASEAEAAAAVAEVLAAGAPEARFFHGNLLDAAETAALMDAVEAWGAIDILVNNAGIQHTVSLAEASREVWDRIIAINLTAAFETMRRALPSMPQRGYGRVINIASVHGLVASVNKAPYVAAKHGLIGLSKVAALEYAQAGAAATGGVTVNCICPGWTETPILEPQIAARAAELATDRPGAIASLLAEKQPSQRLSDPREIGELVVFLCGRAAHNITGTAIAVDGGWTAQ